ncbi:MAG: hypothetical protein HOQ05_00595 [Corynebacteriales bacterium]|nr:hypothetical protein [Mycobacteriales bacterium]
MVLATELASRFGLRPASALHDESNGPVVPVPTAWLPLFAGGGIRHGSTVSVLASLAVVAALMSATTQAGLWCAVVGAPALSAAAAARAGVELSKCVFVNPGSDIGLTLAPLSELDLVVIGEPQRLSAVTTRQVTARARNTGAVLIGAGRWPGADIRLRVTSSRWEGIEAGYGHLTSRRLRLEADGRRIPIARHIELVMGA